MTRYIDLKDRIIAELRVGPATSAMLMDRLNAKRWAVDKVLHALMAKRIVTRVRDPVRRGNYLMWWKLAPPDQHARSANRITVGRGARWRTLSDLGLALATNRLL